MKLLFLTIFLCTTLYADSYKLYFGTFDATHPKLAEKNANDAVEKAKRAGLVTRINKIKNKKGSFLIVESVLLKDKESYDKAKELAKSAGLDFFSKRFPSKKPKSDPSALDKPTHRTIKNDLETNSSIVTEKSPFFGSNQTMVSLIETGLRFQKKMAAEKEMYLKSVADAYDDNGLGVKLLGERALNRERNGIETGIVWDLFKDGYMHKRHIKRVKQLQNGIRFDADSKNISDNYREITYYDIENVKNLVRYHFTKKRLSILAEMKKEAKKRVRHGVWRQDRLNRIDAAYQKAYDAMHYFTKVKKKPFDWRYKDLIKNIEKYQLLPSEHMELEAKKNSFSLQMLKARMKLLDMGESWTSKIKTDIYIDRKQYTFIDRRETLAGIHVKIPYNLLSDDKEMRAIERRQLRRKVASEEMLIKDRMMRYRDSISFNQNKITRMQDEIASVAKEIEMVKKREELGIIASDAVPRLDKMRLRLHLLELQEQEWILRAEILQKLIDLQYISGIRVL
jgi:hypothetical protein